MKTKNVLTGNKLKIFLIVLHCDGCTINLLLEKLAEHFNFYPGISYYERLLAELLDERFIDIEISKSSEVTEHRKSLSKPRRHLKVNNSTDNPAYRQLRVHRDSIAAIVRDGDFTVRDGRSVGKNRGIYIDRSLVKA